MPSDFPLEIHDKTHEISVKYKNTYTSQWRSFGSAWNGFAYRYRGMNEYHQEFTNSISRNGNSPPHEERFGQEKALFGFFTNAISAIDCFFYSVYWLGAILKPDRFPTDPKTLKRMYPMDVAQKFKDNFPGYDLTSRMLACVSESKYIDIKDMRMCLVIEAFYLAISIGVVNGMEWQLSQLIQKILATYGDQTSQ